MSPPNKTVVGSGKLARIDAKEEGWTAAMDKSVQCPSRPTTRPAPESFDTVSSRWSASTDSVYGDDEPFQLDKLLDMFPVPPKDIPNVAGFDDRGNPDSLSTAPVFASVFASHPNPSSSSVATITPQPLPPKAAVVVGKTSGGNRPFAQVKDSIVVRRARIHLKAPMKDSSRTSSQVTSITSAPERGPVAAAPPRSLKRLNMPPNIRDLIFPRLIQIAEDLEFEEQSRVRLEEMYEEEQRPEDFPDEFGVIRELKLAEPVGEIRKRKRLGKPNERIRKRLDVGHNEGIRKWL